MAGGAKGIAICIEFNYILDFRPRLNCLNNNNHRLLSRIVGFQRTIFSCWRRLRSARKMNMVNVIEMVRLVSWSHIFVAAYTYSRANLPFLHCRTSHSTRNWRQLIFPDLWKYKKTIGTIYTLGSVRVCAVSRLVRLTNTYLCEFTHCVSLPLKLATHATTRHATSASRAIFVS